MKIELNNNKVYLDNDGEKKEIHPFWLRERVNGDKFVDIKTKQRLFDPTQIQENIKINDINLSNDFLEVTFNDGAFTKLSIQELIKEFSNNNFIKLIKKVEWDSSLNDFNIFEFKENLSEKEEMYNALISFYKYGFVIFKNVPTKDNFLINFANSIGSVRRTNFGEFFNVKSKPNPNDLAYTALNLSPHTDNPYRNPFPPCIQILHCIENDVKGGYSTLVDGFTVTEDLKKLNQDYYNILTSTKVRFKFSDKDTILESWAELIHLDEKGNFQNVRFSPRLDYVPQMKREKLEIYYNARKCLSDLYNSEEYRIEFKLMRGDLMMMDNHRLLHGRTSFDPNEGNRFLQGCYLDFDSTEGKLLHLRRKFNL